MTHFTALIILPSNTINIREKVSEILHPYYSELEVEPYKEYLDKEQLQLEINYLLTLSKSEIQKLADEYEVSGESVIKELAKINLDWDEEDIAGVDEVGEYKITNINPLGKWDWYSFIEVESGELESSINYPCRVKDLPDVIPYAVITPDGKWYEAGWEVGIQAFKRSHSIGDTNIVSQSEINWDFKVRELFVKYPDFLVVALNFHY